MRLLKSVDELRGSPRRQLLPVRVGFDIGGHFTDLQLHDAEPARSGCTNA